MKLKIRNRSSGMTLLEVMIAMLLLCVGIMAVAAMLDVSKAANIKAQSGVEDAIAAASMLERILALPYDDPRLEDHDDGFNPQDPDHGPFDVGARRPSTIEWEVDSEFPTPNTKRILITVRPKVQKGTLSGYFYDYVKTRHLTYLSTGADTEH